MTAVMGYDPGVTGGLAVVFSDPYWNKALPFNRSMTETDILEIVKSQINLLPFQNSRICYVEKVGFIKGDGGKGAFTFGGIYKLVRGMLLMANVKLISVPPMVWQSAMGCLTGGNKNVSKRKAIELFPRLKITHATADALLIAEYGRRREERQPSV